MIGIDMEMPKSCAECPCEHDAACYVKGYRRPITLRWHERQEKREEWCPLIDLTEEGK